MQTIASRAVWRSHLRWRRSCLLMVGFAVLGVLLGVVPHAMDDNGHSGQLPVRTLPSSGSPVSYDRPEFPGPLQAAWTVGSDGQEQEDLQMYRYGGLPLRGYWMLQSTSREPIEVPARTAVSVVGYGVPVRWLFVAKGARWSAATPADPGSWPASIVATWPEAVHVSWLRATGAIGVWAATGLGLWFVASVVRAKAVVRRREADGRCGRCGYVLLELTRCPECGTRRTGR